jgi:hypothetical protein
VREGKFQQQVAIVAGISALLSGFEAYYSHYKNNFRYKAQWSPIIIAPLLAAAAFASARNRRIATTATPALRRRRRRRGDRFLLSRARRTSPSWWPQAPALQHHVRAADLRSASLRSRGNAGLSRQSAPPEARMKKLSHEHRSVHPMQGPDTALLPRDAVNGDPLQPKETPGYYPGFSTMTQKSFWDEGTRNVVDMRVEQTAPIRYFNAEQVRFWRAVFDHLIPQHDRVPERRIPLIEPLDERLYQNRGVGYRYDSMPPDFAMPIGSASKLSTKKRSNALAANF